jgi:hypothetical protein
LVAWTIGIEIKGARVDDEDLVRLLAVFERDVPNFVAGRALWSGRLIVHGRVESEWPAEALTSALMTISSAFDQAGIDEGRRSEVTSVTLRRARSAASTDTDSLTGALLRRIRNRSHSKS